MGEGLRQTLKEAYDADMLEHGVISESGLYIGEGPEGTLVVYTLVSTNVCESSPCGTSTIEVSDT